MKNTTSEKTSAESEPTYPKQLENFGVVPKKVLSVADAAKKLFETAAVKGHKLAIEEIQKALN